ncbi:hypothetical protein KAR91_31345 [Candidatus Pacearchaeota archaeon]|nr:hypothetical protein [Candidatus Pacearchaeota archaeon]
MMNKEKIIIATDSLEGLVKILNKDQKEGKLNLPTLLLVKISEVIMGNAKVIRMEANQPVDKDPLIKTLEELIKKDVIKIAELEDKLKNLKKKVK